MRTSLNAVISIAAFSDAAELMAWWNSDEQKQARRDFGLAKDQVEALKQAVINKREALHRKDRSMSGSINKVTLVGNVGADPEVKRTQDGRPVVNSEHSHL